MMMIVVMAVVLWRQMRYSMQVLTNLSDENLLVFYFMYKTFWQMNMANKMITFKKRKKKMAPKKATKNDWQPGPSKRPRVVGMEDYSTFQTPTSRIMSDAESSINPQSNKQLKLIRKKKMKDAKRLSE